MGHKLVELSWVNSIFFSFHHLTLGYYALSFVIFFLFLLCGVTTYSKFIDLTWVYLGDFLRLFFNWYNFNPFSTFLLIFFLFWFHNAYCMSAEWTWVLKFFLKCFFKIDFFQFYNLILSYWTLSFMIVYMRLFWFYILYSS